jgi:hypothetical protein
MMTVQFASGRISPWGAEDFHRAAERTVSTVFNPKVQELARAVGIDEALIVPDWILPRSSGLNLGQAWFNHLVRQQTSLGASEDEARKLALEGARSLLSRYIDDQEILDHVMRSFEKGRNTILVRVSEEKETFVHEICHTLADKLKLPYDEVTPKVLIDDLYKETGNPIYRSQSQRIRKWLSHSHEAFTEVLTRYFLRHLRPDGKLHRLAEALIKSSDDPAIRALVGTAVGAFIAITGAWKELPNGRTSQ